MSVKLEIESPAESMQRDPEGGQHSLPRGIRISGVLADMPFSPTSTFVKRLSAADKNAGAPQSTQNPNPWHSQRGATAAATVVLANSAAHWKAT